MKNLEHSKSTILGFLLLMSVTIFKFAPFFFPEATYEPSNTVVLSLYGLSIGLIVLYPEPFKTLVNKIVEKWSK